MELMRSFSPHYCSLTPNTSPLRRPALQMVITGPYCDSNSQGRSSCPVIFSTGENPAKHRHKVHAKRESATATLKLNSVIGCALVCVQSKQPYRLLKVVPTCILYAQNYVLCVALFSPHVVKRPLCFAVLVSRPQL